MKKSTALLALVSIAASCQTSQPSSYRLEQNVPACRTAAEDASDAELVGVVLQNVNAHLAWHETEADSKDTAFPGDVCRELAQIVVSYAPTKNNLFETVAAAEALLQRVSKHCAAVGEQGRALIREVDEHSVVWLDQAITDQRARVETLTAAAGAGPQGDDTLANLEQRRHQLKTARDRLERVLEKLTPARAAAVSELVDAVCFERRARPRDSFDSSVVITMPQTFASRFGPGLPPTDAAEVSNATPKAPPGTRVRAPTGDNPANPAQNEISRRTTSAATQTARTNK